MDWKGRVESGPAAEGLVRPARWRDFNGPAVG
jgi:hypothetical protein